MAFEQSTHCRHWLFSPEKLRELRNDANAKACERISKLWQEETATAVSNKDADQDVEMTPADSKSPSASSSSSSSSSSARQPLTPAQEARIQLYFLFQIRALATKWKFQPAFVATAMAFYKRYYVFNSVMDYDPMHIMLACVHLTSKAEEQHIDVEQLASYAKLKPKHIIRCEVPLLEGLRFHLVVFHPYRPLRGFIQKFAELEKAPPFQMPTLNQGSPWAAVQLRAAEIIAMTLHSDMCLLFPPNQIALAAIAQACAGLKVQNFETFLTAFLSNESQSVEAVNKLLATLKKVQALMGDALRAQPPGIKEATALDKQRRVCRNPALDPSSSVYKNRQAKLRKAKKEKKQKKHAELMQSQASVASTLLMGTPTKLTGPKTLAEDDDGGFVIHGRDRVKDLAKRRKAAGK